MRTYIAALLAALVPLTAHAMAGKEQAFGEGVTGDDRVKIAELHANPDAYVGQTVRVEGVITKFAEKRGAWVELTDNGAVLRVDVNARKMSFPDDAIGKRIAVEGVFSKRAINAEAMAPAPADSVDHENHGKSDLPTGERGKSEYAHAAEHGKSAVAHAEKADKATKAAKAEKPDKAAKAEKPDKAAKPEKPAKMEKSARGDHGDADESDDAVKPVKAEKLHPTPRHSEHAAQSDTVVYELEATGAILL